MKTKMKQIVKINWKINDLIRTKKHSRTGTGKCSALPPPEKTLRDIKEREQELADMRQAALDAEV